MDQRAGGCRTLLSCILNAIVFDRKPFEPSLLLLVLYHGATDCHHERDRGCF